MPGILPDNDIEGQFRVLRSRFEGEYWRDVWVSTGFNIESFESLGLSRDVSDVRLWQECQRREVVLVTSNRNKHKPDSLESALRDFNVPTSLPVFTIASAPRVVQSASYADRVVERLLDYLSRIDDLRGTGRLYLP